MWFAPDWELKPPKVHLKPPPLQCEVSASWFRAQNPPLPLKPSLQCMEVWCQWRPSADGSSDSPQLPTNSPEVRTSPNFPTWSAVIRPKVIKNKNYRLPAPKTLLIRAPACLRACCTRTGIACNSRPDQIAERSFCPFSLWEEKYSLPWRQQVKERVRFSDISWRRQIIAEKIQREKILAEEKKQFLGEKYPASKNSLWKKEIFLKK